MLKEVKIKLNECLLSIIIPVYNGEKYIKECLNSITKNSNIENYEIIIINDGSNDNTYKIINTYKKYNVKIYNNTNHGVSYSRNYGIQHASGKYIMFVDSDDKLKENWYSIVMNELNDYLDMIIFTSKKIKQDKIYNFITGANMQNICIGAPFSKLIKREIIEKNNIQFNENLINGEDMVFNCSIIKKCNNIKIVNNSFYMYRSTPNSVTNRFDKRIIDNDYYFNIIMNELLYEKKDIIKFNRTNGLYTILDRISYCKQYKIAEEYYNSIDKSFYKEKEMDYIYMSNFKRIINRMFYKEAYWMIFIILKFRNIIKIRIKRKKKFSEI